MLGLVLMAIGKVVQASSFSYGQLVAGRFVAGFGNGFNTAAVPAWQAESTRAHRRGTMLMVSSGACIAFGVALAYWITFAFAWLAPSSSTPEAIDANYCNERSQEQFCGTAACE